MAARKKPQAGIGVVRVQSEQERSQYIATQVALWARQARALGKAEGTLPFITVSRQAGCLGFEVGRVLAERLNRICPSEVPWAVYDREIVQAIAGNLNMSTRLVELLTERSYERISDYVDTLFAGRPSKDTIFKETVRIVQSLMEKGHAIVIGRGGCLIGSYSPLGFHLRLIAPLAWRVEQIATAHQISREEAERRVAYLDAGRQEFFEKTYGRNISDPELYDLILNQARFSPEHLAELVIKAMEVKGFLRLS